MFIEIPWRSPHNYDVDVASNETALSGFEPTLTVQDSRDDCDINVIMERFGRGIPVPVNVKTPLQGDFTEVMDYQQSLNLIREADAAFMQMPANVRSRFENDPGQFLDFVSDPVNTAEAIALGIAIERPQDPVTKSPGSVVVPPSDSAAV